MPSSPMRFVCGTRTSSKWIRPVSLDIMPILRIFFALVTPGRVHRHHDQALVLVRRAFGGVGEQAHPVGLQAVGDPHLGAVDDVVAAVLPRRRLDAGDVGAGARLGDADAADRVAGDRRHQELAAQRLAAEAGERGRAHVGLHADRHRHAAAGDVAERLGHRHRVRVVEAHAAVLLGLGQAEQAELAEALEDLVRRELLGRLPLVDVRIDLLVDEALERALDLFVLVRELHAWSPVAGVRRSRPGDAELHRVKGAPRRLVADREREGDDAARVARVDEAVVEEQARGVEGVGLALEGRRRSSPSAPRASPRRPARPFSPRLRASRSPSCRRPARRPSPPSSRSAS